MKLCVVHHMLDPNQTEFCMSYSKNQLKMCIAYRMLLVMLPEWWIRMNSLLVVAIWK